MTDYVREANRVFAAIAVVIVLVFVLLTWLIIRTTSTPPDANKNQAALKTGGELVGTLPDGRDIKRIMVDPGYGKSDHTIYIVDGTTTITTNRLEAAGKTLVNRVEAAVIETK